MTCLRFPYFLQLKQNYEESASTTMPFFADFTHFSQNDVQGNLVCDETIVMKMSIMIAASSSFLIILEWKHNR